MDELLAQFLIEAPELVQQGSDALLALERDPTDRTVTDDAFRAIHTLKGSVGLFDLPAMGATLHAAEDVLSAIRAGVRAPDRATIDALLAILTQSERWIAAIASGAGLPPESVEVGRRLAEQLTVDVARAVDAPTLVRTPDWAAGLVDAADISGPMTAVRYTPIEGAYFNGDDPVALVGSLPGLVRMTLGLMTAPEAGSYDPFACRLILSALTTATAPEVHAVLRLVPDQVEIVTLAPPAAEAAAASFDADGQGRVRTLRVDAARVEDLAAMIDELVAARGALAALSSQARAGADPARTAQALAAQSENLDRLTGRLHRQVMGLRMTPVAPLLRRFPRVARDLARSLGKDIDFIVDDGGVEADKTIIEGLFEPLTHLVRNAIDHGVEAPGVREASGKHAKGVIRLTATAGRNLFTLRLEDDGAGMSPDRIRSVVRDRGLVDAAALAELDDAAVVNLVFLPGFSTAETVSDLSGRGVGMDAVKIAVQRLGGRIAIDSLPGEGTAISLSLPLSVSLTRVMVVAAAGETWGIPMDRVVETLRVPRDAVVPVRAGEAFNWRDQAIPLLPLAGLVGAAVRPRSQDARVLVVRSGNTATGIAVDAIDDRADLAVRPLEGLLAAVPGVSGSALLGDGRVLMILDPEVLVG